MSCTLTSGNISNLGCDFFTGGIKRVFISQYYGSPNVVVNQNDEVVDIDSSVLWIEFAHGSWDNSTAVFTEKYNPDTKDYTSRLVFDLLGWTETKHITADVLAKGSWMFVFQDFNGRWWLTFFDSGSETESAEFSTGIKREKNQYQFVFRGKTKTPALKITQGYVDDIITVSDCADSYPELALSSLFFIPYFQDCLVCEHPDSILVC